MVARGAGEREQRLHGAGGVLRDGAVDDEAVGDADQFGEERAALAGVGRPPEKIGEIGHQQRRGDRGQLPLVFGADVDGDAFEDDSGAAARGFLLEQIDATSIPGAAPVSCAGSAMRTVAREG